MFSPLYSIVLLSKLIETFGMIVSCMGNTHNAEKYHILWGAFILF